MDQRRINYSEKSTAFWVIKRKQWQWNPKRAFHGGCSSSEEHLDVFGYFRGDHGLRRVDLFFISEMTLKLWQSRGQKQKKGRVCKTPLRRHYQCLLSASVTHVQHGQGHHAVSDRGPSPERFLWLLKQAAGAGELTLTSQLLSPRGLQELVDKNLGPLSQWAGTSRHPESLSVSWPLALSPHGALSLPARAVLWVLTCDPLHSPRWATRKCSRNNTPGEQIFSQRKPENTFPSLFLPDAPETVIYKASERHSHKTKGSII